VLRDLTGSLEQWIEVGLPDERDGAQGVRPRARGVRLRVRRARRGVVVEKSRPTLLRQRSSRDRGPQEASLALAGLARGR
jgi:hypothetical protein